MSGTSLDGVDAVLVDFEPALPRVLGNSYQVFPSDLRDRLLALHHSAADELNRAALAANELAIRYADVVEKLLAGTGQMPTAVRAIGCHGQTVRHDPARGYTLQLNNPSLVAELSGITVVADFRSRDIAAGGQGAPLVPAFHDVLFREPSRHRVVLNIGGIANLTRLAPGHLVAGHDCGPGNMLLDAWIREQRGLPYDDRGIWASSGSAIPDLLERLLAHPFFGLAAPKSCGREEFDLPWLHRHLAGDEDPADVQATLLELTARSIAQAVTQPEPPEELLVCGGGARNTALVRRIAQLLGPARVAVTDEIGIDPSLVEAMAFAWLARQTIRGLPGNLPAVTGARGLRVLGGIYPA